MRYASLVALLVVLGTTGPAAAAAPPYLPVQGVLTNLSDGTPVEGDLMLRFALYTSEVGGVELWNESQWVLVEHGLFAAYLGDATALPLALFRDNTNLYLGVSVGGESEMARFQLATTGFAGFAQYADDAATVGGRAAGDFADATHSHAVAEVTGAQARVTGTCPAGNSIRTINPDGTVICEPDDDTGTTYSAGPGLTLSGTQFAVSFAGSGTASTAARSDHTQAWSTLTGVPAGFADGTDDTGSSYTAGTGILISGTTLSVNQTTVEGWARGVCYDTATELRGALDAVYAPTAHSHSWSTITSMPAGFADGIDNDTTYSWSTLPGLPAGFADGIDNDTIFFAGTGLSLSGTTFSADTAYLQRRVSSSCAVGSSIRAIDAAGGVLCEVDDLGTGGSYTAGAGISISGTTISIAAGGVVSSMIADGTITTADIGDGQVSNQDIFGTTQYGRIHNGATGQCGQAAGWDAGPYGDGTWLEACNSEGGGIYFDGDVAAVWSPGDASRTVGGRSVTSVFEIYDEDSLPSTTPLFAFGNGTAAIGTWTNAYLTSGGVWTNASDRNVKENFSPVDPQAVLERVAALPITEWNYISEDDAVRHVGPMAQDFHAAFGLGNDNKSLGTIDVDGVALASIQALHRRNEELQRRNAELEARVGRLEALVETLAAP